MSFLIAIARLQRFYYGPLHEIPDSSDIAGAELAPSSIRTGTPKGRLMDELTPNPYHTKTKALLLYVKSCHPYQFSQLATVEFKNVIGVGID